MLDHAYAVVLAGGSGTRFWPLSRRKRPKQLLALFGRRSLLEETLARIRGLIPPERTFVFTNELLRAEIVRRVCRRDGIPAAHVVAEPAARNTAPTIGLAAHEVLARDPEGLMVVLPSDHVILKPGAFRQALRAACALARGEGQSVILGIRPTRPDTGYGYLGLGSPVARIAGQRLYRVEKFEEKPNLKLARRYLASGRYLWNAGMFIWRASTVLENFKRYQPRMAFDLARMAVAGGVRARSTFRRLYPKLKKISIDYALMEKITGVYAVAADLGWSDVGSWAVAYELSRKDRDGNVGARAGLSLSARRNMIVPGKKFVVTVGVEDLIIVETEDALLVCTRERSQDVGKAVAEIERRGLSRLL